VGDYGEVADVLEASHGARVVTPKNSDLQSREGR
jgi:hypothetical protein